MAGLTPRYIALETPRAMHYISRILRALSWLVYPRKSLCRVALEGNKLISTIERLFLSRYMQKDKCKKVW